MKTIIAAILLIALSTAARAQEWTAMAEFGVGEQYFNRAEYENALDAFEASYKAMPLPAILFDLALTHFKLDNVYLAREYLRMFLRHVAMGSEDRKRAERLGDKLASLVEEDMEALGLSHACDYNPKTGVTRICAIAHWSEDVQKVWAAEEARAQRKK